MMMITAVVLKAWFDCDWATAVLVGDAVGPTSDPVGMRLGDNDGATVGTKDGLVVVGATDGKELGIVKGALVEGAIVTGAPLEGAVVTGALLEGLIVTGAADGCPVKYLVKRAEVSMT